ncbi:MAG: rRNA maturation RNase YbeY [Candidatus Dormibacteria bacterium]
MQVTVVRAEELSVGALTLARAAGVATVLRRCGDELDVGRRSLGVRLTTDAELRSLNARFLGVDAATDVLAFPADEPRHVGDIAISVERAAAQGDDAVAELRLLAVHGLLHCLGHDHDEPARAAVMTALTRRLLPAQAVPELVVEAGTPRGR